VGTEAKRDVILERKDRKDVGNVGNGRDGHTLLFGPLKPFNFFPPKPAFPTILLKLRE
jgi:hypothetical protein